MNHCKSNSHSGGLSSFLNIWTNDKPSYKLSTNQRPGLLQAHTAPVHGVSLYLPLPDGGSHGDPRRGLHLPANGLLRRQWDSHPLVLLLPGIFHLAFYSKDSLLSRLGLSGQECWRIWRNIFFWLVYTNFLYPPGPHVIVSLKSFWYTGKYIHVLLSGTLLRKLFFKYCTSLHETTQCRCSCVSVYFVSVDAKKVNL